MRKWLLSLVTILSFCFEPITAQSVAACMVVSALEVKGNTKTKERVVLRELSIEKGSCLDSAELMAACAQSARNLFNMGLFHWAKVIPEVTADGAWLVKVELEERWFWWMYPTINFADRNFNIWWETQSLSRLNYGLNFQHQNLTGMRDQLKLHASAGYTRALLVDYERPWPGKNFKNGWQIQGAWQESQEAWYRATDNRLRFFYDPRQFTIREQHVVFSFVRRPGIYTKHYFRGGAELVRVSDSLIHPELNEGFLAGGLSKQGSVKLIYTLKYDRRDVAYYALNGHFIELNAEYRRFIEAKADYFQLNWNVEYFRRIVGRWSVGAGYRGKWSPTAEQPYRHYRALGYKFFVRGYEQFVIDGAHFQLLQTQLRHQVFKRDFYIPLKGMTKFNQVPVFVYVTANSDLGRADGLLPSEWNNTFVGQWLWGGGPGIDIVTYYDRVMRIEYSFSKHNRRGGLFLHFTAPI